MEGIDEQSSAQLNINDLPTEILKFIFSFLNFKERIKIERDLTDYMLEEILKRSGKYVLVLDLILCSRLTAKALSIIGDHCRNLRSVKCNQLFLTDCDLGYFSNKCTKLKEAVLFGSTYGEEGLRSLLKSCQELEVLYIRNNENISGQCFQFISPKLKKLVFSFCTKLTSDGFLKLGKCKCIEYLELHDCHESDTASLKEILKQNCNSLKHLGLIGKACLHINYQATLELLTKLESISFQFNKYIGDDTLLQIAQNCKNLRTLDVSCTNITDMGLKHLTSCPLLTTLDVSYADNITDLSIIPLAMVGKLESLTIRGNHNITDNACNTLAVHCMKLKYLDLSRCTRITDATARSFINAMGLRNDGHRKLKIFTFCTKISVFIEEEEFIITKKNFPWPFLY